jgi:hypothetical protein
MVRQGDRQGRAAGTHVSSIACQLPAFQRADDGIAVDQLAARGVDHIGAALNWLSFLSSKKCSVEG